QGFAHLDLDSSGKGHRRHDNVYVVVKLRHILDPAEQIDATRVRMQLKAHISGDAYGNGRRHINRAVLLEALEKFAHVQNIYRIEGADKSDAQLFRYFNPFWPQCQAFSRQEKGN